VAWVRSESYHRLLFFFFLSFPNSTVSIPVCVLHKLSVEEFKLYQRGSIYLETYLLGKFQQGAKYHTQSLIASLCVCVRACQLNVGSRKRLGAPSL
jgi:hypothetical protein